MTFKEFLKTISWELINPIILRLKRNRKYNFPEAYNGINIGCGIHNPQNWIGVDGGFSHYIIHKIPKYLYKKFFFGMQNMSLNYSFEEYYKLNKNRYLIHHELLYGLPFYNNSIPNIYSSHLLEHFFYEDAYNFLKECYRVLKPKGIIRLCVPSLSEEIGIIEKIIADFKKNNTDEIQKIVTSNIVGYNSKYSNHRYMYDLNRLSNVITKAGFKNIIQYSYKKGKIIDVEYLDVREGLFVEATKLI